MLVQRLDPGTMYMHIYSCSLLSWKLEAGLKSLQEQCYYANLWGEVVVGKCRHIAVLKCVMWVQIKGVAVVKTNEQTVLKHKDWCLQLPLIPFNSERNDLERQIFISCPWKQVVVVVWFGLFFFSCYYPRRKIFALEYFPIKLQRQLGREVRMQFSLLRVLMSQERLTWIKDKKFPQVDTHKLKSSAFLVLWKNITDVPSVKCPNPNTISTWYVHHLKTHE